MTRKWRQACVLAALFGLAALCGARADETKAIDLGKAEEFKGKTVDLKAKDEAAIILTFAGGKKASVTVRGEKQTDVHLLVYDADGKVVAKDDSPGSNCDAEFTPKEGGKFRVVVRNLGPGPNCVPLKVKVEK